MIKVFGQTDTTFTSNGNIVIQPLKAKVHKSATEYYLDIEVELEYLEDIVQGVIVVAETPQGEQAFRVNNVTQTGKKISARCKHVFFDSETQYFTENVGSLHGACNVFTNSIYQNTKPTPPFYLNPSQMSGEASAVIWYESMYSALMKVAEAFDCQILMNNYVVTFTNTIGQDNGVVIQYGKNLKDISCAEDWTDVCTRIYPFGANGITVDTTAVGLDNPYIDGSTQYHRKYIKAVEFDQSNIQRSSYASETAYKQALVTDLIAKGEAYLDAHALPEVTYTLKANVEKVSNIGDTIVVIDERLGLELETTVTAFDYDSILGKITEVTFGNYRKTAKGMGLTVQKVASNQQQGILADKRLLFNSDNSIKWEYVTPQP